MLNKLKSTKDLPYELYVSVLIPNDTDISNIEDIDGYLLITKSPKMTIIFLEYKDGQYDKVSKEVWNKVQLSYKNQKKSRKIDGKRQKISI